jgi:nucleoside-diphosphate-sugar epimerase
MIKIKVAVTGAAGHIGSVLVRRMLEFPHIDSVAICRNKMSAGLIQFVAPGADIRIGSITDSDSAQKLLGDCDVIVNCALSMISGKPKMSRLLNKAMIDNFSRLKKLKSLIHMSSITVYGAYIDSKESQTNTFEQPRPNSDYGRSKLYIEQYANRMCISKQLKYYLLRLGHVIGAKMDRSRQIIELAQNPQFSLPLSGNLPSNTIHVEHLAANIISLFSYPLASGIYNVADEDRTWRQVFDWHTQSIGLPPVKGMSKEHSERLKATFRSASITRDLSTWFYSLPILGLIRYPTIFEYAYRFVANMPQYAAIRLATTYKLLEVRRQIAAIKERSDEMTGPVFFVDAMPGSYLRIASKAPVNYTSSEDLSYQLGEWYKRSWKPGWLPDSISQW